MTPQSNPQIKVYIIFTKANKDYVDHIEDRLGDKGIELIRYDKEFYAGRRFDQVYRNWADNCDAILLLVSNAWNNMQDYMEGELAIVHKRQSEWHRSYGTKYRVKNSQTGKIFDGNLQLVYPVALEDLQDGADDSSSYFGDYENVNWDNIDEFITKFITRIRRVKTYILSQNKGSINKQHSMIPQTGTLQMHKFNIQDLLKKPISSIWTSPAKSFTLEQRISSLSWTGDLLHIRHFPIVDANNKLISIISLRDILEMEIPDREVLDWLRDQKLLDVRQLKVIAPVEFSVGDIIRDKIGSQPITIGRDTLVSEAIELLSTRRTLPGSAKKRYISALPCVDENWMLVGIVSYLDILTKVNLPTVKVKEWMLPRNEVITLNSDATLEIANSKRGDHRDLPILDIKDGAVIGMISEYELFKNKHSEFQTTNNAPVTKAMKHLSDLRPITPETSIEDLVGFFRAYKTIGCIAVTDGSKRPQLQGVISYIDILRRMMN